MAKQYSTDCTNTLAKNFVAKEIDWENSPESKLAEISIREFCLLDYSPSLTELSAQF